MNVGGETAMTGSQAEEDLSFPQGRRRFAAIGLVIRVLKALPEPLRERALDALTGGVSGNLPPFGDVRRLVEAAGGIPDGRRWQTRLLASRPYLRAVRTRDVGQDDNATFRARVYLPPIGAAAPTAALVWVHGGAFVLGSLDAREAHWPAMELAASGIPVLTVSYRMCIGSVCYPAPQDDVLAGWRWAVNHADHFGVRPEQLHLGGASAGGCIVAGTTLRLRDAGERLPASIYLAYPVLEGRLPPPSPEAAAALVAAKVPPDEWIAAMFGNWAGSASWDEPRVSPALGDLAGLPPTYVLTCGQDALRRSSEHYVHRLSDAGVTTWQDLLPDAEHAPLNRPDTPDGERALARLRTWLNAGISGMGT